MFGEIAQKVRTIASVVKTSVSNQVAVYSNPGSIAGSNQFTFANTPGTSCTLTVGDNTTTPGNIVIGKGASGIATLTMYASGGSMQIATVGLSGNYTFTLPNYSVSFPASTPSSAGTFIAGSNGAGNLNFSTPFGAFTSKSASFTAVAGSSYINSSATSITVTLPTAVGCGGALIGYAATGSSTTTVNTTSSQTVGGKASGVLTGTSTSSAPVFWQFVSDGTNWHYSTGA